MTRIRLGAPADLEATPLVTGLDRAPWSARAELARPAARQRVVEMLDEGELDVAVVPADALAPRAADLEVVPGIAIGSAGPSLSARLLHRAPLAEVRSVASAAAGHAAETLCRLLFAESGRAVTLREWSGAPERALEEHDAVLLAGDAAVTTPSGDRGERSLDLGEAWTSLTGLPFVWSVWAARPGVVDRDRYAFLHAVRTRGRHLRGEIVASFARRHGLAADALAPRFEAGMSYRLGRKQLDGLRAFWSAGAERRLVEPAAASPRFVRLTAGSTCLELAERISRTRRRH